MAQVTLADFAREQRRLDCPACQLPKEVRVQLRNAHKQAIRRPVQLAWLQSLGFTLTHQDMTRHYNGRHDVA